MTFQPANFLHIVADCPEELRACDVTRLHSECGENWGAMKTYLLAANISPRVRNAILEVK